MKYCSQCGASVETKIPEGDNLPRHICTSCQAIHYQNPKIVVGCIPEWEGRLLLCRRAIEPRYGLWTLPAGFMENDETTVEGAVRETMEEAGARVEVKGLFAMLSLPHINQVYIMYRGELTEPVYSAGTESLEVGLFHENEIPWEKLAFSVIQETLKCYYADRARNKYRVHTGDLVLVDTETKKFETRFLSD